MLAHSECKIGGLPLIIINMNIIIVLILSYLYYNTKLNINTIIGILIALVGLGIVILSNN